MDSLIEKVYYLPMSSLVKENLDFCGPNPAAYEKLNPSRHTHWQWVTNKGSNKWAVLTGMPIVCSPARGSLKSSALDRVVKCFIRQFTNSYEGMGMTPRTPKVGASEFQNKAGVSGTSLGAKWVQFLQTGRLSSRRACCSAPEGRILSEWAYVCTYTHKHTQWTNPSPSGHICTTAPSFTAQSALWKRGHKDCKKGLTSRKAAVKQSVLRKWNQNNSNINGHTDVEGGQFHRVPPLNKEPDKGLLGEGGLAFVGEQSGRWIWSNHSVCINEILHTYNQK